MSDAPMRMDTAAAAAISLFIEAVRRIAPDGWDQPSTLAEWTVRDLVGHATGSATKLVALVEDREIWTGPSQPSDWVCEDPAARLRDLAARLQNALPGADMDAMRSSPRGQVPLHRALAFPVADLAVHSWDLHRSQGRFVELPDDLLALCHGLVASLPEDSLRRPGAFGPARPAPEDATPTARLMAHLGRPVTDPSGDGERDF